jgi:hypothetical protein
MKSTVLTEKIGGFIIVKGFDRPVIEPFETRKKVEIEIKKTDEWKAFDAKKKAIENECKMAAQARKSKALARKNKNVADVEKYHADDLMRTKNAENLMAEMGPIKKAMQKKHKELMNSQAVYFSPRPGEEIIEPTEVFTLSEKVKALKSNEVLLRDGTVKPDFVGKSYWKKGASGWAKNTITEIGKKIPTGGKLPEDLTGDEQTEISEQLNLERIGKLSISDKESEKLGVIDGLAGQAATMKSKLEIQSDSQALQKSQDWYNAEVLKIEEVYK